MRRTAIVVLVIFLATTALATAASFHPAVKTTVIEGQSVAREMALEELLTMLSERTGIAFVAVPEVAGLRVALPEGDRLTVEEILSALRSRYGLDCQFNALKKAAVIYQLAYNDAYPVMAKTVAINDASLRKESFYAMAPSPAGGFVPAGRFNTEEYKRIYDNNYQEVLSVPVSTFSIDVDTASYSNMRRFINSGKLPPADAVRTEELINYFAYDYRQPTGGEPFSVTTEVGACPWQPDHKLVMIGLQGKNIRPEDMPPGNLVFLIDVSGSMASANKLPLLKTAFKMLVKQLRDQDRVAIVVYAGRAGLVLEPTPGSEKEKILKAIDSLQAGGSTAGGEGIRLAYKVAREGFLREGNNRVILATDGDFNVGVSSEGELTRMIEERREDGIYLSVLGFGMGNIKDNKMEALADKGNGTYAYIDNAAEAKKVLVGQLAGTLYTIAKDVKLQVEFNPAKVKAYRLVGYENRVMDKRDFNDDKKDAGDMGAGHSVTAFYEIIPAGSAELAGKDDPLVYQRPEIVPSSDLLQLKIRYKRPGEEASRLFVSHIGGGEPAGGVSENFRFAAAVAEYAMLLRDSEFKGQASFRHVLELARGARGTDAGGYRAEFIRLVEVSDALVEK